jgi:hypothetical protein
MFAGAGIIGAFAGSVLLLALANLLLRPEAQ